MKAHLENLEVKVVPIGALRPYAHNARTHSKQQIARLGDLIHNYGWLVPILIDTNFEIIAGHGRLEAAKLIKLKNVPVIQIEHLNETQIRMFRLADNKIAQEADWNFPNLKFEINELIDEFAGEFDISAGTAFDHGEIDRILGTAVARDNENDELAEEDITGLPVTQAGDTFELDGKHRIHCGNARDRQAYIAVMADKKAEMAITDPPYNVPIAGNVSGLGQNRHQEFLEASGEMDRNGFIDFLTEPFKLMAEYTIDGAIIDVFMDHRHALEIILAGERAFTQRLNICVWTKTNGGMGSLYRSAHEFGFIFKSGKAPHINNIKLGKYGRNRTNVWSYAGANSFGIGRDEALAMHPTVKPVGMIGDAVLDCSNINGIVLDPFMGSGTILIAAHRTGRQARGIELDPKYVDVALRRFRRATGIEPIHVQSNKTFSELEAERTEQAKKDHPIEGDAA